jgi:hypothetical protein
VRGEERVNWRGWGHPNPLFSPSGGRKWISMGAGSPNSTKLPVKAGLGGFGRGAGHRNPPLCASRAQRWIWRYLQTPKSTKPRLDHRDEQGPTARLAPSPPYPAQLPLPTDPAQSRSKPNSAWAGSPPSPAASSSRPPPDSSGRAPGRTSPVAGAGTRTGLARRSGASRLRSLGRAAFGSSRSFPACDRRTRPRGLRTARGGRGTSSSAGGVAVGEARPSSGRAASPGSAGLGGASSGQAATAPMTAAAPASRPTFPQRIRRSRSGPMAAVGERPGRFAPRC